MGLFSKFKKNKVEETEQTVQPDEIKDETQVSVEEPADEVKVEEPKQQEETTETNAEAEGEVTETTATEADEDRRFTLMVENAFQLEDENGVVVVGNLHGKIKKGDKIYLLFPNNRMLTSVAEEIEIGPGRRVTEAEDDKIALQIFEIKEKEHMPPFTIITNIVPNPDSQVGKEIENPLLLGMSMEYPTRGKEAAYNNMLVYILCHTKYVVPAGINTSVAAPGKGPQIQFPSIVDPSDTSRHVLPVFTDWNALSRWEGIFDENHPEHSVVMSFQDAVSVCQGRGIVINPFGPMVISVSAENIQQIVNLESYKKEFGNVAQRAPRPQASSGQEATQKQEKPRLMLGVPKADNPEVKAVTDAIVAYAKGDTTIKRIDLLLKADLQQKKSFVCIIDCPMDQTARIAAAIEQTTASKLKEVEKIEFFLYGSAKFVNDMVTDQSVIYQKN